MKHINILRYLFKNGKEIKIQKNLNEDEVKNLINKILGFKCTFIYREWDNMFTIRKEKQETVRGYYCFKTNKLYPITTNY